MGTPVGSCVVRGEGRRTNPTPFFLRKLGGAVGVRKVRRKREDASLGSLWERDCVLSSHSFEKRALEELTVL